MTLFAQVAELADQLAATSSRLQKRALIADAIARVHAEHPSTEDAGRFALYLAGQPFAESDPRKLNAGGALTTRLVRDLSGATDKALTAAYRRHGDLGAAAYDLLRDRALEKPTLTLSDIAGTFNQMATARTTAARTAAAEAMLRCATALEVKYLIKLMLGDMRIGVKQSLVEEAIAAAVNTSPAHEVKVEDVRHAVMLEADLSRAVTRAFNTTLSEACMTLFHPLGFMLASPVDTPEEAIERFTEKPKAKLAATSKRKKAEREADFEAEMEDASTVALSSRSRSVAKTEGPAFIHIAAYLEDKYDGMRAQLHCGDPAHPGRVAIYSRNREDVTESFPELTEAFAHVTEPLILDGEILGWNLATGTALPFATLGQRIGRKSVSAEWRRQIPVVFMAFDLLYANDELLLPLPLHERHTRLEAVVHHLTATTLSPLEADHRSKDQHYLFAGPESQQVQRLLLSPSRLVESAEAIDRAYRDARARSNEGVMLKRADSVYLPGRRGLWWLKLKRKLATLDVVITGAEFGHGKRNAVLSDYTFAVRADQTFGSKNAVPTELLNVGKAYSGLTDPEIAELTQWLKAHTLEDHGHFRTVEPQIVLEVAFNNIMRSPRHASGFALRFPRIVRIRNDKPVSEIDTLARVEEIYLSQIDRPSEAEAAPETGE